MTEPAATVERTRVLLVDDHHLCRRGLGDLLEQRAGMHVVATTALADDVPALIDAHSPQLVVTDLRMQPFDGLALLERLHATGVRIPVVVLTMSDSPEDLATSLRLGARGYILKDMAPEDIVDAIRRVARGDLVVAPEMAGKLAGLLSGGAAAPERNASLDQLTAREREILGFVSRGLSNKAIANDLGISQDTVKLHVRHILSKLNLRSRVEAAVFAIEHRLDPTPGDGRAGAR
ncbi:MAG: response regulator [Lautropia sp.]